MFCHYVFPFPYSSHLSLSAGKFLFKFSSIANVLLWSYPWKNTVDRMGTKKPVILVCIGKFPCARVLGLPAYHCVTHTNTHSVRLWRKTAVRSAHCKDNSSLHAFLCFSLFRWRLMLSSGEGG